MTKLCKLWSEYENVEHEDCTSWYIDCARLQMFTHTKRFELSMTLVSVIWVISDMWLHCWRLFTVFYLKQSSSIYPLLYDTIISITTGLQPLSRWNSNINLSTENYFYFYKGVCFFFFWKRKFRTDKNKTTEK